MGQWTDRLPLTRLGRGAWLPIHACRPGHRKVAPPRASFFGASRQVRQQSGKSGPGPKSLTSCARHLSRADGAWRSPPGQKKKPPTFFVRIQKKLRERGNGGPSTHEKDTEGCETTGACLRDASLTLRASDRRRVATRIPTDDGGIGHMTSAHSAGHGCPCVVLVSAVRKVARDRQLLSEVAECLFSRSGTRTRTESLGLTNTNRGRRWTTVRAAH